MHEPSVAWYANMATVVTRSHRSTFWENRPKPDGGVSGVLGWVSGTYAVKDKSGKVLEIGKYLSVSHKKGGKWLYVRDTWSADAATAPEPAAPAKK